MRTAIPIEAYNLLTSLIYSAALDWRRWSDVFSSLYDISGGVRISMYSFDARMSTTFSAISPHYSPEFLESYVSHYGQINAWGPGVAALPIGCVARCEEALPYERLKRTAFYNEWVRPQDDVHGGGGVTLARDDGHLVVIAGNIRHVDIDQLEDRWMELLGLLTPHLRRALDINRLLNNRNFETMAAEETNRLSGSAILVIDPSGLVLYANAGAEALMAVGAVLARDLRGRLCVPATGGSAILAAVGRMAIGATSASGNLTLTAPDGQIWHATTVVFDPRRRDLSPFGAFCSFTDRCLLLTLSPHVNARTLAQQLVRRLALTQSEAEVAVMLAEGASLAEIAAARKVSIHTIRNQVKSALSKTGARRQSDLTRSVLAPQLGG